MRETAAGLASLGRGPDTMLVHMSPREVAGLQQLAMAHGGSLTTNPHTGLPEAGFLSDILPAVVGVGLTMMGVPAWGVGLGSGLTSLATGKDAGSALMSGLLAGGGAALFGPTAGAAGSTAAQGATAAGSRAADFTLQSGSGLGLGSNLVAPGSGGLGLSASLAGQQGALLTPELAGMAGGALPTVSGASGAMISPQLMGSATGVPYSGLPATAQSATPSPAAPGFFDKSLAWAKANPIPAGALGLGALGALGGLEQEPLSFAAPQQQESNYRRQLANRRPYDPTAPGGYFFTDRGIVQPNYGYAKGGSTHSVPQLEDGGFVLTKKAVDGIGKGDNEKGQRRAAAGLGAIPIKGPGTGTSDSIPTTIDGKRPALVSNGEAYVPKREVKKRGGAKKFYALMKAAERKAARA